MPSFESTPQPKVVVPEKSPEELEEIAVQARGFKIIDKRVYLDEAVKKTERDLAWKGFEALSQKQKAEIVYQLFNRETPTRAGGERAAAG